MYKGVKIEKNCIWNLFIYYLYLCIICMHFVVFEC